MDPILTISLLAAAGVMLLVAEMLLPTHGVLGVVGMLFCIAALVFVFSLNKWVGLATLLVAVLGSPFIFGAAMSLWTRSPVGRRLILQPLDGPNTTPAIAVGQIGTAVTELRPMGECDFGDIRLEVSSELGIIGAGERVKVVALVNGRPTVRPERG